jgi:hypothetical protein
VDEPIISLANFLGMQLILTLYDNYEYNNILHNNDVYNIINSIYQRWATGGPLNFIIF